MFCLVEVNNAKLCFIKMQFFFFFFTIYAYLGVNLFLSIDKNSKGWQPKYNIAVSLHNGFTAY